MVRDESHQDCPDCNRQRWNVLKRWNPELDEVQEQYEDKFFYWEWPRWIHPKSRLPKEQGLAAQNYINFIVKGLYSYSLRERMGRELWLEFCEYYAINPDFERALRYL